MIQDPKGLQARPERKAQPALRVLLGRKAQLALRVLLGRKAQLALQVSLKA